MIVSLLIHVSIAASVTEPHTELTEALTSPEEVVLPSYQLNVRNSEFDLVANVFSHRPNGERIEVLAPLQEDRPDKFDEIIEKYNEKADGDIWCDNVDELIGEVEQRTTISDNQIRFQFKPDFSNAEDKTLSAYGKVAKGEVELIKEQADTNAQWQVKSVRIALERPFKPTMMAKITELNINMECQPDSTGRMYFSRIHTSVKGSALGNSFEQEDIQTISDVRFADGN